MSKLVQQATEQLRASIVNSMEEAVKAGDLAQAPLPAFNLEIPADHSHGDWSCNAAMAGAKAFRAAPRKIAEAIVSHLDLSATYFDRVEIAGPGFLNFFFSPRFQSDVLRDILALDENYGRSDYGQGKKVMVEFVSANPTGPMHMGNARGGALGDCLAAVLDAAGYDVWREFYVNDAGNQIEKFGLSLSIRYQQLFAGENAPAARGQLSRGGHPGFGKGLRRRARGLPDGKDRGRAPGCIGGLWPAPEHRQDEGGHEEIPH